MRLKIASLAACVALGGCVSLPAFHMPSLGKKSAPTATQEANAPSACPASITADLLPAPDVPADAKLPAIETGAPADLQAGFQSYTGWLRAYSGWGRTGWLRLHDAQVWCASLLSH